MTCGTLRDCGEGAGVPRDIRESTTGIKTEYGKGGTNPEMLPDECVNALEEAPGAAGIVVGVGSSFTRTAFVPGFTDDAYGGRDGLEVSRAEDASISLSQRPAVPSKLTTTELPELPVMRRARSLLGQNPLEDSAWIR